MARIALLPPAPTIYLCDLSTFVGAGAGVAAVVRRSTKNCYKHRNREGKASERPEGRQEQEGSQGIMQLNGGVGRRQCRPPGKQVLLSSVESAGVIWGSAESVVEALEEG